MFTNREGRLSNPFLPFDFQRKYIKMSSDTLKSSLSRLHIWLIVVIAVLATIIVFMLFNGSAKDEREEKQKMAKIDSLTAEMDEQRKEQETLLKAEREQLEAERKSLDARKRAEEEAQRLKSSTGVYTGVIYGVKARLSLKQNGTVITGTYTGNTRKYTVDGTVDDDNNFDIYIYNDATIDSHVTGSIQGRLMKGTWDEYLTGNVYEFKLTRQVYNDRIISSDNKTVDNSLSQNVIEKDSYVQNSNTSEDWNAVLEAYEKYVDQYIRMMERVNKGDNTAISEYPGLLAKAEELQNKLERAKDEMTSAQINRLYKIQKKLLDATQAMQ